MPTNEADIRNSALREPKGIFQETVRRLAEAAMTVTHHDIDHSEPEAISEIQAMERAFTNILRGKLRASTPTARVSADKPFVFADPVRQAEWERQRKERGE